MRMDEQLIQTETGSAAKVKRRSDQLLRSYGFMQKIYPYIFTEYPYRSYCQPCIFTFYRGPYYMVMFL